MNNDFQTQYNDDWDAGEYARKPVAPPPMPPQTPANTQTHLSALAPDRPAQATPMQNLAAPVAGRAVPRKSNLKNFPGFIARSAMFRASSTDEYFSQPTAVRAQGCALMLSGPKLGMRDKHVWETAIQIAKERAPNIGESFQIELRDFARRMGSKNHCGPALTSIWESLERLARCGIEFKLINSAGIVTCQGIGSLLATAFREGASLYLRLNPDFTVPALMGDKQFLFDQRRRRKLPLALSQWLHDYYSTHEKALDIDLLYLRELCGYDGSPRNFPARLRAAMHALIAVAPGLVASFEIEEIGRSSDDWKLRVVVGVEKPSFLPPQRIPNEPKSRRGGVNL